MSLYLHVVRVNINDEGIVGGSYPYGNFAVGKFVGDRELLGSGLLDYHIYSEHYEESHYRPTNFNLAHQWVDANVEAEGNRERLHSILNELQQNPELYLHYN